MDVKEVTTPLTQEVCSSLRVGDALMLSGVLLTGRDAVLPRVVAKLEDGTYDGPSLEGAVIFHSAVSVAGIGPTSSNKLEIAESMEALSKAGVRIHLGKGALSPETVALLVDCGSLYAVTPPVTALFNECIVSSEVVYGSDLGMEAMHRLVVKDFPLIIAAAGGESLYD